MNHIPVLTVLIGLIAGVIAAGTIRRRNMWKWICLYWLLVTLRWFLTA